MLVSDRHGHTAIVVKSARKWAQVVAMKAGQLVITRMPKEKLEADWKPVPDYPLTRAICRYLDHPGGVSPAAQCALEDLLSKEL